MRRIPSCIIRVVNHSLALMKLILRNVDVVSASAVAFFYRQSWVQYWASHPDQTKVDVTNPWELERWSSILENLRQAIYLGLFTTSILFAGLVLLLQRDSTSARSDRRKRIVALVGLYAFCISISFGLLNMWIISLNPEVLSLKYFLHSDDAVITFLTLQYASLAVGTWRVLRVGGGALGQRP